MKKLLVIDDSKTQLLSLKIFFSKHGMEVETAENGIDGYKMVIENPPDAVICDVMMPNLNGYQFARLLKNNPITQKIPIILLTSLNQNIDRFWGKQAGADLFLSKNVEFDELLKNVQEIFEKYPVEEGIKKTILNTQALKNALQIKINNVLDTSLMEATIMNEFRKLAKNIDDSEEFLTSFFELISSIFNYNLCSIHFYDKEFADVSKIYYATENCDLSADVAEDLLKSTQNLNENVLVKNIKTDNCDGIQTDNINFKTQYCVDLSLNDTKLAKLALYSYEIIDYESFQFFEIVKNELALLAKVRNLYTQTKFLSITDGLTSLYNRRYFFENIEREFARASRYKTNLSVAMLDIDFFKSINDKYGHQTGDAVLKDLSNKLISKLRRTDLIFRYGGEEFVILLPETDKNKALIPLERLRTVIQDSIVEFNGEQINYTVSIGIADLSDDISNVDKLVENADNALYNAKNSGRNRVIIYE